MRGETRKGQLTSTAAQGEFRVRRRRSCNIRGRGGWSLAHQSAIGFCFRLARPPNVYKIMIIPVYRIPYMDLVQSREWGIPMPSPQSLLSTLSLTLYQ
jgi:hypothetical protein